MSRIFPKLLFPIFQTNQLNGRMESEGQVKCGKLIRKMCSYREYPIKGKTIQNDWPSICCWHLLCPPRSVMGLIWTRFVIAVLGFLVLFWFCLGQLPGDDEVSTAISDTIYAVFIIYVAARSAGFFFESLSLPGLLGEYRH